MVNELREFVYLDSMSVNSLLASQQMAVPETVREVSEDIDKEGNKKSADLSLGYNSIAKISGSWTKSDSEENRRVAETERRINDQYRFSILHRILSESDELIDFSEIEDVTSLGFSQGDVVKATGSTTTDPFYRLFSSLSSLMRFDQLDKIESQNVTDWSQLMDTDSTEFDVIRNVLHGDQIGLKIDPENYHRPILMSVNDEDLWITPEREFRGHRNYTVVGRVSEMLSSKGQWDFVDIINVMEGVFSEESIEKFRNDLLGFAEDINEEEYEDDEYESGIDVDRSDFVIEESSIVIDPIAIYW